MERKTLRNITFENTRRTCSCNGKQNRIDHEKNYTIIYSLVCREYLVFTNIVRGGHRER